MKIPNAQNATVDMRKLRDYCLNPEHNSGKHKARIFNASLGMGPDDAEALREALLKAVKTHDAEVGNLDVYGQRYTIDFPFEWHGKQAIIRSGWIIALGSDVPRLVTAYPLQNVGR